MSGLFLELNDVKEGPVQLGLVCAGRPHIPVPISGVRGILPRPQGPSPKVSESGMNFKYIYLLECGSQP